MEPIYIGRNFIGKDYTCYKCRNRFTPGVPWALFVCDDKGLFPGICDNCVDEHFLSAMDLLNAERS